MGDGSFGKTLLSHQQSLKGEGESESYLRKHWATYELLLKLHMRRESTLCCLVGKCQTSYQRAEFQAGC